MPVSEGGEEKRVGFQSDLVINQPSHYCPGCHYGIMTRILAEVIEELDLAGDIIGVSAVGCSIFSHVYLDIDFIDALHGRAPEVASGIKAAHFGKKIVFTLQGDGDLAAIGMGDFINAIARGEHLTTIFLNNANYGTTGGQMAPTTVIGQKSTTTPVGRKSEVEGYPIHVAELIAPMQGLVYSARCAMNTVKNVRQTKKAITKALRIQMEGGGYSFVEVLSACPAGWKLSPAESLKWIEEKQMREFPLGVFKDETEKAAE